jgi:hypothetical protein
MTTPQFAEGSALALAMVSDPDFVDFAGEVYGKVSQTLFAYRNIHSRDDQAGRETLSDATWAWDNFASELGVPVPSMEELTLFAAEIELGEAYRVTEPSRSDNPVPIHWRLEEHFPQLDKAIKQAVSKLTIVCLTIPHDVALKASAALQNFLTEIGVPDVTDEQVEAALPEYETILAHVVDHAFGDDAA